MLMIDTLTKAEKIKLIKNEPVGLFPYLILSTDSFYALLPALSTGYYTARSGNKSISPAYEFIRTTIADNSLTDSAEQLLANSIRTKFLEKWNRVYTAMIATYEATSDYNITESKTGKNTDTTTYNSKLEKNANNSNNITYNTNVTDDGKTATHEITTRDGSDNNDIYGFNSNSPVGDTTSTNSQTETVEAEADKNTSHNTSLKTGTENTAIGVDEDHIKSGTDTIDHAFGEEKTIKGNKGSISDLIQKELDLRNRNLFFDIVYADIDSVATLQIYI